MSNNPQRNFEVEIGIATTGQDDKPLPKPLYCVTITDKDKGKQVVMTRVFNPNKEKEDMESVLQAVTETIRLRVYHEITPAPQCPYCKFGLMRHPKEPNAFTTCPDNRCLEWRAQAIAFNTDVTVLCKAISFRGAEFLII